jgi:hypothetical protein
MTRPNKTPSASMQFKVFVKGEDGRWRVASMHATSREAQWTADLLVNRQGFITRVMM